MSIQQFKRMFLIEIFGTFSLTMPAILTRGAEYQGVLVLLCGTAMAAIYLWFLLTFQNTMQDDYGTCLLKLFGKTGSRAIVCIYLVRFVIRSAYTMLLFVSLIKSNLLKSQNRFFLLLPFCLLCLYVAYQGLETRGRALELLFWVIFVPLLFVVLLSIPELSLHEMLPKGKIAVEPFFKTTYLVFLTYSCMEFLLFHKNHFRKNEKFKKSAWKSFGMASGLYFFLFLVTIGLFGVQLSKDTLWPAFAIMETAKLPADFISRLDILLIAFWIFSMFGVASGYITYAVELINHIFLNKQKGLFLISFFILSGGLTLLLPDIEQTSIWFASYMMWIDFPIAFFIPFIIWCILTRKRGTNR